MLIKLADIVIEIKPRYEYTRLMCAGYIYNGSDEAEFSVSVSDEKLEDERKRSPGFPMSVIENTCIYRAICEQLLKYNAIFIHSAALSVDNEAYLFSANSGTGKTTHMNLWLERFGERAFVINGDKPILREVGGKIFVYGTPWCGKEGLNRNARVPLKGICILSRAEENRIAPADRYEALMFLLTQTTRPKDKELAVLMLDKLGSIIENIPIYKLGCNMDPQACEVCYEAMK